ncbi:hypothetical protein K523DRAFT_363941 [Schizophyllum commune Tattone D]|nr:hypothetical protein K523DRAFT_363941 [Schizophyllum commune Tattone D]
MGQYWLLLDLDARKTMGLGKLGESFFGMADDIFDALFRVQFVPVHLSFATASTAPNEESESGSLTRLPFELIDKVFASLDDVVDIVCLAFTCSRCYAVGEGHIHPFAKAWVEASAGHRIIVVGDYCRPGDLPSGMELTPGEKALLLERPSNANHDADNNDHARSSTPQSLYEFASRRNGFRRFYEGTRASNPEDLISMEVFKRLKSVHYYGEFRAEYLTSSTALPRLFPDRPRVPPDDTGLVLRNLSRHAYVTGSAVLRFNEEHESSPGLFPPGRVRLADAVMARVCWSSDDSIAMPYEGPLHRGVWAGNRFDIVDEGTFEMERKGSSWTDVSDEVLKEVEAIWMAEGVIVRKSA